MIRIGLIGAGKNGQGHLKQFVTMPERCRIVAVADPVIEAAESVAREYGATAYADFSDCFDEVDALIISTPNWLHPEHAIACAEAGKHVWIEKPMALTTADADRMAAAIDAAGVQSFVGFSVRFDGVPRTMSSYLHEGRLGELVSIFCHRMSYFDPAGTAKSWRFDYGKSGGVMTELMVHEMDWMVHAAGVPQRIVARKTSRFDNDPRDNEHVWLQMDFATASGTIEGSQMSRLPDYQKSIVGSDAAVSTRAWGQELWFYPGGGDSHQIEPMERFDKHSHFLDVLEGQAESVADVHYGRVITALAERTISSAVSGEPVDCTDLRLPATVAS